MENLSSNQLPEWDLKDFYSSHKSKEITTDLNSLSVEVKKFSKKFKYNLKKIKEKDLLKSIGIFEKLEEKINFIRSYVYLLYSTNQLNQTILAFYQKTNETLIDIESDLIFFTLELNFLPDKQIKILSKSKYFPWVKNTRKFKKYQKSEKIEKILLDKNLTSSNSWIRLFDQTMAGITFDYKNQKVNESEILNQMSSSTPSDRKKAAYAFGVGLKKNINTFALITNTLAKDLEIDRNLRGFKFSESFRHLNNQVEKKDVDCLTQTVMKNYSSLSHRYYKYKAKAFKTKKLNYWDRNAPYPKQKDIKISWKEGVRVVLNAYEVFDKRISDIAKKFFENQWIHATVIKGKSSGAFSHPTVPSCHPYILINYQNKLRDVMTLAHEIGHGIHQYLANDKGFLISDTPLTLAETASVFGEMLTFKSIFQNAKNIEEKKFILISKIEDMLNTVVRQISFFEFERKLHHSRKESELTVNQINDLWLKTQSESLGNSVNLNGNYKYFWSYIPHFIHSPFYVYAYAFGDCLVNALWYAYQQSDKDIFSSKYIEMLSSGGTKSHNDLLKPFNLSAYDNSFWEKGITMITGLMDELDDLDN